MKKLLGILVLGLLLSGNAYADDVILKDCWWTKSDARARQNYTMELQTNFKKNIVDINVNKNTGNPKVWRSTIASNNNGIIITDYRNLTGDGPKDWENYEININNKTIKWNYYKKKSSGKFKLESSGPIGCGSKTLIAEKPKKQEPKKKKPKTSPDDNKIVPAGSGSGFIVSKDGTVITNYHVIEGCELNKVTYKGSQLEAKVLSIDKVNDIAILKTNISSDTAFSVSNEDVSLLEDVVVAGFPLGKQISSAIKTHKGVVTALAGAGDNYSFFQTDAAINQGNSGGPIINQKGNVIGIAVQTWVEEGVQGVLFGIKSSTLKTFASANGLKFLAPNNRDLSNKELGKLITESTVYVECHMTIANIKKMIAEEENKKAFFKDYQ